MCERLAAGIVPANVSDAPNAPALGGRDDAGALTPWTAYWDPELGSTGAELGLDFARGVAALRAGPDILDHVI
jgi:hypothetical protein